MIDHANDTGRFPAIRFRLLGVGLFLVGGLLLAGCRADRSGNSEQGPDRMRGMMEQMMGDRLPPGISPEELPDPESRGATLTAEYCSSCHALPSPRMHSASDWPAIADRMFRRMDMMSGMMMSRRSVEAPSEKQQEAMVQYLQAHGLQEMAADTSAPPTSTEEKLFRETCSSCHALPDPSQHSAEEWPAVVARMQQNIEAMNHEPISAEEAGQITAYLQKQARK